MKITITKPLKSYENQKMFSYRGKIFAECYGGSEWIQSFQADNLGDAINEIIKGHNNRTKEFPRKRREQFDEALEVTI